MKKEKKTQKSSKDSSWRFPTLVGLISLIGLFLGLHFLSQQLSWTSRAGVAAKPKEVKMANISANSFSVSWQTDQLALGAVRLDLPNDQELILNDVRESEGGGEYYTHYVVVGNLSPNQEYQFFINSNGRSYGQESKEDGRAWKVKTAPLASQALPEAKLAYGQVVDTQGEPVGGALVYVAIPQLASLSSLSSESGYWVIPFAFAYGSDLSTLADYQEGLVEEEILVEAGPLGRSVVSNITRNNKPVPPITLGENSDFRDLNGLEQDPDSNSAGQLPPSSGDYEAAGKEFTIINPEDEEGVATFRPEIFGTVPFGGAVEVVIESETIYQGEAEVDDEGFWRFSPPGNLEPGEHTVTAILTDGSGERKTLIRNFVVLAAEDGAAFTATASGDQVSPTPTPTTPAPEVTVTPAPTQVVATNTPVLTTIPTVVSPLPTEIPQTGFGIFSNLSLWVGGVVVIAGASLLLLL